MQKGRTKTWTLIIIITVSLIFPLRARADLIYGPASYFRDVPMIGLIIILTVAVILAVITWIALRIPVKRKKVKSGQAPDANTAPMKAMKSVILSIVAFLLAQVVADLIFILAMYLSDARHPFESLASAAKFGEGSITGYFFVCGLMAVPIYFFLGMIVSRVFRFNSKKTIAGALIGGVVLLSALWFVFVYLTDADYSYIVFYIFFNIPAGWAYVPILSDSQGYLNSASLFLTVFPPLAFAAGIWVYTRIIHRNGNDGIAHPEKDHSYER